MPISGCWRTSTKLPACWPVLICVARLEQTDARVLQWNAAQRLHVVLQRVPGPAAALPSGRGDPKRIQRDARRIPESRRAPRLARGFEMSLSDAARARAGADTSCESGLHLARSSRCYCFLAGDLWPQI